MSSSNDNVNNSSPSDQSNPSSSSSNSSNRKSSFFSGGFFSNLFSGIANTASLTVQQQQLIQQQKEYQKKINEFSNLWTESKDITKLKKLWVQYEKSGDKIKRDQLLMKEIIPLVVQVYETLLTSNKKAPQTTRALTGTCDQSNSFLLLSFEKIFPTQKKKDDSIMGIAQSVPILPTMSELTIPESGVELLTFDICEQLLVHFHETFTSRPMENKVQAMGNLSKVLLGKETVLTTIIEALLVLSEKDENIIYIARSTVPSELVKFMELLTFTSVEEILQSNGITASSPAANSIGTKMQILQSKLANLLHILVHNRSTFKELKRSESITTLFRIICAKNVPSQNFHMKHMAFNLIKVIAQLDVQKLTSHLYKKKLIPFMLNSIKYGVKENVEGSFFVIEVITFLLQKSCSASNSLLRDFELSSGYHLFLDTILECEDAFKTNTKTMNAAIKNCADLVFVGERDLIPDEASETNSAVSMNTNRVKGNRIRNLNAFQAMATAFLKTKNSHFQQQVLENFLFIFAEDLKNYLIVSHLQNVSLLVRNIDEWKEEVQILIMKLLEFIVTALNINPREELRTLVDKLKDPITPKLADLIFKTITKLLKFDNIYKTFLREARVMETCTSMMKMKFSNIINKGKETLPHTSSDYFSELEKSLLATCMEILVSMLDKSRENIQHYRDSGSLFTLQQLLEYSLMYRDSALQIFQSVIEQDIEQKYYDISVLSEALMTTSNITLKLAIFDSIKKLFMSNERTKDSFREYGFTAIVAVIQNTTFPKNPEKNDHDANIILTVLEAAFRLMTIALEGHYVNKQQFIKIIGDESIPIALEANGILNFNKYKIKVMQFILDFATERFGTHYIEHSDDLVEIGEFRVSRYCKIPNPYGIAFFFKCITDAEHNLLLSGLQILDHLGSCSPVNMESFAQIELVGYLLKRYNKYIESSSNEFHAPLMKLLEKMASYKLSGSEWRQFLSILKVKEHPLDILQTLVSIANSQQGSAFLHLEPNSSCYQIAMEEKVWPPANGYSFSLWFSYSETHLSISKYAPRDDKPLKTRRFTLLHLESVDRKSFLKIGINSKTGHLEWQTSLQTKPTVFSKFSFVKDKWYHIGLVHSKFRIQAATAALFVNGQLQQTEKLVYVAPCGGASKLRGYYGKNAALDLREVNVEDPNQVPVFNIGCSLFYEDALPPNAIAALYMAGSSYGGYYQGDFIGHVTLKNEFLPPIYLPLLKSAEDKLFTKMPASEAELEQLISVKSFSLLPEKILFAFNPRQSRILDIQEYSKYIEAAKLNSPDELKRLRLNAIFLQNLPNSSEFVLGKPLAMLQGKSFVCVPNSLSQSVLQCEIILAVFGLIERAETSEYLYLSLQLLLNLFRNNSLKVHTEFDRNDGYHILAFFLRKKAHLLNSEILKILWGLCILGSNQKREIITNLKAFQRLILDNEIWRRTSIKLQEEVFNRISDVIRDSAFGNLNVMRLKLIKAVPHLLRTLLESPPIEIVRVVVDCVRSLVEQGLTEEDMRAISEYLLNSLDEVGLAPDEPEKTFSPTLQGLPIISNILKNAGGSPSNTLASSPIKITAVPKTNLKKRTNIFSASLVASSARNLILRLLLDLITHENATSNLDIMFKVVDVKWFLQFIIHRPHPITCILIVQLVSAAIVANYLKSDKAYPLLRHGLSPYANQQDIYHAVICMLLGKTVKYSTMEFKSVRDLLDNPPKEIQIPLPQVIPIILNLMRNNEKLHDKAMFDNVSSFSFFSDFVENEKRQHALKRWQLVKNYVKSITVFRSSIANQQLQEESDAVAEQAIAKVISSTKLNKTYINMHEERKRKEEARELNLLIMGVFIKLFDCSNEFKLALKKQEVYEALVQILFANCSIFASTGSLTGSQKFSSEDVERNSLSPSTESSSRSPKKLSPTDKTLNPLAPTIPQNQIFYTPIAKKVFDLLNMAILHEFQNSSRGFKVLEDILAIAPAVADEFQIANFKTMILLNLMNSLTDNEVTKEFASNPKLLSNTAMLCSLIVDFHSAEIIPIQLYETGFQFLISMLNKIESLDSAKKKQPNIFALNATAAGTLSRESVLSLIFRALNRFTLLMLIPPQDSSIGIEVTTDFLWKLSEEGWLLLTLNALNKDQEFLTCLIYALFSFLVHDSSKLRDNTVRNWRLLVASIHYPILNSIMTFKVKNSDKNETVNMFEGFKNLLDTDSSIFNTWFMNEMDKITDYFDTYLQPTVEKYKNSEKQTIQNTSSIYLKSRVRAPSVSTVDRRGIELYQQLSKECKTYIYKFKEDEEKKISARREQDLIISKLANDKWTVLKELLLSPTSIWFSSEHINFNLKFKLNEIEGPMRMRKKLETCVPIQAGDVDFYLNETPPSSAVVTPQTPLVEENKRDTPSLIETAPIITTTMENVSEQKEPSSPEDVVEDQETLQVINPLHTLNLSPSRPHMHHRSASALNIHHQRSISASVAEHARSNSFGGDENPFFLNQLKKFEELEVQTPKTKTSIEIELPSMLTEETESKTSTEAFESQETQSTITQTEPTESIDVPEEDVPTIENDDDISDADMDGDFKIRKLLEPNDSIISMYNCLRITGLDGQKGLFVVCLHNSYIINNYTLIDGKVSEVTENTNKLGEVIDSKPGAVLDHSCFKLPNEEVKEILKRRFLLRITALELFCRNGKSYFIVFEKSEMEKVYQQLTKPTVSKFQPLLRAKVDTSSISEENRNKMTAAWQRGEVSNFEYLMYVNTCAGRTYNDLTQYPVFPWIIADYKSEVLDLTNPKSFRDLSRPMGALNESRREQFIERFRGWEDPYIPKFHYGTHYSSAGTVLYYMIRLEPYSRQAIELQGGRFDVADRLFFSVGETWYSAAEDSALSDVKELIPEFYYMPEFLMNNCKLNLGKRQSGEYVHHVELPPWCHDDPEEFIRINRKALESDYVSEHLHEWIDLIFGYKQLGKDAEDAVNVFFYLTYEGAVDIDAITDPIERKATISQISNFGQTPHQLFKKPHPKRNVALIKSKNAATNLDHRCKVFVSPEDLIPLHEKSFGTTIVESNIQAANQQISYPPVGELHTIINPRGEATLHYLTSNSLFMRPKFSRYFAWGFADNSLRIYKLLGTNNLNMINEVPTTVLEGLHWGGRITCADTTRDGKFLVLGGDSLASVWSVWKKKSNIKLHLKTYLRGHTKPVTCVAVSSAYNVIVTGSADSKCILWDLDKLTFVKELEELVPNEPISCIQINEENGNIVACSSSTIFVWSINGKKICSLDLPGSRITALTYLEVPNFSQLEDSMIITGHEDGKVKFFKFVYSGSVIGQSETDSLLIHSNSSTTLLTPHSPQSSSHVPSGSQIAPKLKFITEKHKYSSKITCLHVQKDYKKVFAGDANGQIVSFYVDRLKQQQYLNAVAKMATSSSTNNLPAATPSVAELSEVHTTEPIQQSPNTLFDPFA